MAVDWTREIKLSDLRPRLPRRRRPEPSLPLMRAFDLLPREEPGRRGRRSAVAPLVVALVGVLGLGGVATLYLSASADVADGRAAVEDLSARVAAAEAAREPEDEPPAVDPALADEQQARTAALSGALAGRTAWDRVLRELSLVLPEDVWLTGILGAGPARTADPAAPPAPPSSVTVNGYALAQSDVARFLSRLAVVPELGSVQLLSSAATTLGDKEVVQFSLVAAVKEAGAA